MPSKEIDGLSIAGELYDYLGLDVLAGTGVGAHGFWTGLAQLVEDLAPRWRALLATRRELQDKIDAFFKARQDQSFDAAAYEVFLKEIGYLKEGAAPVAITTENLDAVVGAGAPQYVVSAASPRMITRAINARWCSLYDALYVSDLIPQENGAEKGKDYNKTRGALVIARGRAFLDTVVPLSEGSHADVLSYTVERTGFIAVLANGTRVELKDPSQFAAYQGRPSEPSSILLTDKGLYVELKLDKRNPVGKEDKAGLADIVLEASVTCLLDFGDSVVTIDARDKINTYKSWLGTVKGSLRTQFKKNGRVTDRLFSADYRYSVPGKNSVGIAGRGIAMARIGDPERMSDLVLDAQGQPIPELFLDVAIAALIGVHDTRRQRPPHNSEAGSIYIVVPKLQGPEETAFVEELFTRIEDILNLAKNVVKLGIEVDTPRTGLNLAASLAPLSERLFFVGGSAFENAAANVATMMEAGPYASSVHPEEKAVTQALSVAARASGLGGAGFGGKGQIALDARPELAAYKSLLAAKTDDLRLGYTVAQVSSPLAATLFAMLYHEVDAVAAPQASAAVSAVDFFAVPSPVPVAPEALMPVLEGHCYRVLAIAARCVVLGAGAMRTLDKDGALKIEDRSALRFSSLLIRNWLRHGVITPEQVQEALQRMAEKLDAHCNDEPGYQPLAPAFDTPAFLCVSELLLTGEVGSGRDLDIIVEKRRIEVKATQKVEETNRYESLRGATGRMETGEHFFGVSD